MRKKTLLFILTSFLLLLFFPLGVLATEDKLEGNFESAEEALSEALDALVSEDFENTITL
ncbi:hypothetical protein J2T56_000252 [Natronobacillus azotifigens]|uniref:Uncharacterized protein n=1 Tax=Natronobacillus azotifigens TaxID=472978 RepID=A0A9J6R8I7_9BACI|nr:hypothetical protein [Natronobacillus azotifigens]MCZ0701970.1 hypothetical protein [Natronobacillus azotifigens]